MMKRRKLSSTLLLLSFLALGGLSIYKGQLIAHNLKENPMPRRNVWLVGTGDYFIDTIQASYQHLVTDFTMVELNPRISDHVVVDGYEGAKKYLDINIQDDTLYITRLLPDNDTSVVRVNDDYALLARVGAANLKSITLERSGRLEIPIEPYGSDLDGTQRYKPEDWEKHVLRGKELDIYLKGTGLCELFTEVENLHLHYLNDSKVKNITVNSFSNNTFINSNSGFGGSLVLLNGKAKKVEVLNPKGRVSIRGLSFNTDSLIVRSDMTEGGFDTGSITMHCSSYLESTLVHELDVNYYGDPEVVTSARGYGRVIKLKN